MDTVCQVSDTNASCRNKALAIKWKDKKHVTMLSMVHTNTMADVMYNNKVVKKKTTLIINYDKSMKGADIIDLSKYLLKEEEGKKYIIENHFFRANDITFFH